MQILKKVDYRVGQIYESVRLSKSPLIIVLIEVEERFQEGLVKQHIYFIIVMCFILLASRNQ